MVSVVHFNGAGPKLISEEVIQWVSLSPLILFSILTGYFYFGSPKLKIRKINLNGREVSKSENLIFRKMASRIIFWIILGNAATGLINLAMGQKWGTFVDENWYIYGMLVISVVGAFVQKMYFKTKSDAPIYALLIFGMILMIIGFYYIDFDYQFRFWRLGMMFSGLGFGWVVFKLQNKSKITLSGILLLISIVLISLKYSGTQSSHLFPHGSDIDPTLYIFLANSSVFIVLTLFSFSNKYINKLSIISYFILEAHWIAVYVLAHIFANKSLELQRLSYFIEIIFAMFLAYIVYLFNILWVKFIEIHLFRAFDWLTNSFRYKNTFINKIIEKRNQSYIDAYNKQMQKN